MSKNSHSTILVLTCSVLAFGQTYTIQTVVGGFPAGFSGDNGPVSSAQINGPTGVAVDATGNLYIADNGNQRVRKVSNGVITTVAGNGVDGFSGDNGPATSAQSGHPNGIKLDSAGNLYIPEFRNHRVRKVSSGIITTVAGTGAQGFGGDNGPATSALLNNPLGVAVDSEGNLYIADAGNHRVRKVSNGVITTIAGTGVQGSVGDNGPATSAQLNTPTDVAFDSAGNLCIADFNNSRVRQVSNGVITTIAGTGVQGSGGDNGPATSALLNGPYGVAVDPAGNLYIADARDQRIRKVSSGVITTIAGTGAQGFRGDGGLATSALLNTPQYVAVDSAGKVYIADLNNNRVRMLTPGATAVLGSMAHIATHDVWKTIFTLVNTGSTAADARLIFFDDNGNGLRLSLNFPQSLAAPLITSTLDRTLDPGAELVVETTGPDSQPVAVGWAQLLGNGSIAGYAIFQASEADGSIQEAAVPLEARNMAAYVLPFDNTNNFVAGVALANTRAPSANVGVIVKDDRGTIILQDTILLAARGHASFVLGSRYPVTAQGRGTVEFDAPPGGQISVLGLRFTPTGAFSTIPVVAK